MSLLVGLTGGIGSGKSLAASLFKELGAYIIDADQVCKDLVQPGKIALNEIVDNFGNSILSPDGNLDRKKLSEIVFHDPKKKFILEHILHPRVFEAEQKDYLEISSKDPLAIVIIDAALLIESNNYKQVDKVVVIRSDKESQIQRVLSRSTLNVDEIVARMENQMSLAGKIDYADFVLDNLNTEKDLRRNVQELYTKLLSFSQNAGKSIS